MGETTAKWIMNLNSPIEFCEELSEDKMWSTHGTTIWRANRFIKLPHFYPVYRYNDLYSFSPLSLIVHKGVLRMNHEVIRTVSKPDLPYFSGAETIDREIRRIGGPLKPGFSIKRAEEYAKQIADAMRLDILSAESNNPGLSNIILCGGKDSLNMLLLPWKNPVLVASAPPNHKLVEEFMMRNGLKFDLVELRDDNSSLIDAEILADCCRINLQHCRWGHHLKEISQAVNGKCIFWKGQLGGQIMTDRDWRAYPNPPETGSTTLSGLFAILGGRGQYRFAPFLEKAGITQRCFFKNLWYRGAMWQGAHMSIIRSLTNALVLSAYHGPAMRRVLSAVDLHNAVKDDIRPMVGRYLLGGEVTYPSENPGPPLASIRKGISGWEPFLKALTHAGIPFSET